jgi:hypothetical protein
MAALLRPSGGYDRRAIMRKAHTEFRAAKWRGCPWTFSRCLAFAWVIAREQRARLTLLASFGEQVAAQEGHRVFDGGVMQPA